jgi:hypothetical protein
MESAWNLWGRVKYTSFSARRLRRFIPKEGTKLAEDQRLIEGQRVEEDQDEEHEGPLQEGPARSEAG